MRRIGLLGGSFNPAHQGHRRLSVFALQQLALDEVWWLVSPQNPLKPTEGMAPFADRFQNAQTVAAHPRIRVSDVETKLGTRFTADTVKTLTSTVRNARFVWLMGADNLAQLHRWHRWRDLCRSVPVAIVDRPGATYAALASPAAAALSRYRYKAAPSSFAGQAPPTWIFLFGFRDSTSATALRRNRGSA